MKREFVPSFFHETCWSTHIYILREERRLKGCSMPSRPEKRISWEQIVLEFCAKVSLLIAKLEKKNIIFKLRQTPTIAQHSQMCCHNVICSIIISRIYTQVKCVLLLEFLTFSSFFLCRWWWCRGATSLHFFPYLIFLLRCFISRFLRRLPPCLHFNDFHSVSHILTLWKVEANGTLLLLRSYQSRNRAFLARILRKITETRSKYS